MADRDAEKHAQKERRQTRLAPVGLVRITIGLPIVLGRSRGPLEMSEETGWVRWRADGKGGLTDRPLFTLPVIST